MVTDRERVERRLVEVGLEARDLAAGYGSESGYLVIAVVPYDGWFSVMVNNEYWEGGRDEGRPIKVVEEFVG